MLSKSGALLAGIIAERPINPYEINKLLEYINLKNWYSVAASSVYATVRTLERKGYIRGAGVKDGNMPEKKVYCITGSGKAELAATIRAFLGETELDFVKFNIATILICHIPQNEALQVLSARLAILRQISSRQTAALREYQDKPLKGLQVIATTLNHTEAAIKSTAQLMAIVENDRTWNHFLVADQTQKA